MTDLDVKYRYWAEKRITQVSTYNNILLTTSIAFIAYYWNNNRNILANVHVNLQEKIDWMVVFSTLCFLLLASSIAVGFFIALARLYDLRLTANTILTKKRLCEKHNIDKCSLYFYDGKSISPRLKIKHAFMCILAFHKFEITKEDTEHLDNSQKKLNVNYTITKSIGDITWLGINIQTYLFALAIICFIAATFITKT